MVAIYDFSIPDAQHLADLTGISQDLDYAIRFCNLHIELDPEKSGPNASEVFRIEFTRMGLSRAALITYGRCWATGVRPALSDGVLSRLSPVNRNRHDQVMNIRNKWVAHSVNHFDDVKVVAVIGGPGSSDRVEIQVQSQSVGGFRQAFMLEVRELFLDVQRIVRDDIASENRKVELIAQAMSLEEIIQRGALPGMGNRGDLTPRKRAARFK